MRALVGLVFAVMAGGSAAAFAAPRVSVFATPDTVRLSPEEPTPAPTAEYPTLEVARDSVESMLRRGIAPGDTAVHVSRESTRFGYQYVADSTRGLAVRVVVTDTSSCPVEYLENALTVAGWVPAYGYSADGPDGTRMGYVTARFLCVIEGSWDGGDDSDSTYVPAPGCEVTATCVLRREGDEAPKY